MRTQIGKIDGKQLRFLALVPRCTGDNCPANGICEKYKELEESGGRCKVLHNFLKSLYTDWVHPKEGLGEELTQLQLDRIGTHLMPLYHQLARFSLEIASLDTTTYVNKQGSCMAYPQFGELRSVLVQIRAEMKDLKLDAMWASKFGGVGTLPSRHTNLDAIMQHGRTNAYEDMVERAHNREDKVKDGAAKPAKQQNKD